MALFSNGIWKVTFSNDFKSSLLELKSRERRLCVLRKINRLSMGLDFSENTVKLLGDVHVDAALAGGMVEVVWVMSDLHLLWTIDVNRYELVKQIIKIWDLVSLDKVPACVSRLSAAFHVYSPEYLDRCRKRRRSSDYRLTLPETWQDEEDFIWLKCHETATNHSTGQSQDQQNLEQSTVQESLLLMKFYAMSSGIAEQLLSAADGSEVNLALVVNKEEAVLIQHSSSCFILGRSGTGKTTVIVTKLLQREQQHMLSDRGFEHQDEPLTDVEHMKGVSGVRQIIVTLSPYLCAAIKRQIDQGKRLILKPEQQINPGMPGGYNELITDIEEQQSSTVIPDSSNEVMRNPQEEQREVKFDPYSELLFDTEDEDRMLGILPDALTNVPSTCYPMVLTFRKFLIMLENSVPCCFHKYRQPLSYNSAASVNSEKEMCRNTSICNMEVDYERFNLKYWPHLNSNRTKGLDSSTTFGEIMSVIKGSVEAVKSQAGTLTRAAYLAYSGVSKGHRLDINQRENVYHLFLQYEKLKRKARAYDLADYVRYLYQQLASGKYEGDKVDFIYIDEVQDFTQAQLSLFSFISSNTKDGFVFAGDTAQAINQGVNFRFQDARSLFYKDFGLQAVESANVSGSQQKGTLNQAGSTGIVPRFFQLRHNFRTHAGVVNMANSIINLLYHFFPQSIDKLDPETSVVRGELPVILKTRGQQLIRDGMTKGLIFGAHQVILVRDEGQKRIVWNSGGVNGLVLTLNGCKGLEFQDVLVYNFFTDSPLKNKWRVIYGYIQKVRASQINNQVLGSYPTFDADKHNLLCSELKHLYVAVTRARQRLWIYEEDEEFCQPMLDYWVSSDVGTVEVVDKYFFLKIASTNTLDDWRKRGIQLFNQSHFDMAMMCFDRSEDKDSALLAKAANLQQIGDRISTDSPEMAAATFKEAAEIFLRVGRANVSARCFVRAGEFQKAGTIYVERCKPPRYESAGDCFKEAKSWIHAGNAYFKARCLKKCLDACGKGRNFEMGLGFIKEWESLDGNKNIAEEEIMDQYCTKCAKYYDSKLDKENMLIFVEALSNINLKREFLTEKNYINELMQIELRENNFIEAAALAQLGGNLFLSVELLEKGCQYAEAAKKLLFLIQKIRFWTPGNMVCGFQSLKCPEEYFKKLEELAARTSVSFKQKLELELDLLFIEHPRNIEGFRDAVKDAENQDQSSMKFKLLALWNAFNTGLDILKDSRHRNLMVHNPSEELRDRNYFLEQVIELWKNWRYSIISFRSSFYDDNIEEFCYEFFAVTHSQDSTDCQVHEPNAFWLQSGKEYLSPTGMLPIESFKRLAYDYFYQQLHRNDGKINTLLFANLGYHLRFVMNCKSFRFCEKVEVLLRLMELTGKKRSSKGRDTFLEELQRHLIFLLWPLAPTPQEMCHILCLREDSRITAMLDQMGDDILNLHSTGLHSQHCQDSGLLMLIVPYLSELWKQKHTSLLNVEALHWEEEIADFVLLFAQPRIDMFNVNTWIDISGYISPCVYIALLEIAAAMACAYSTCLHAMYLPLTVALVFFHGKQQDLMVQKILDLKEQMDNDILSRPYHLIELIVEILLDLLSNIHGTSAWLKREHDIRAWLQRENYTRAWFNQQVLVLLLVICVNNKNVTVDHNVLSRLRCIIRQCHVLRRLYFCLRADFERAFDSNEPEHLKALLAGVLSRMGNALVMTRRCTRTGCCVNTTSMLTIELQRNQDTFSMLAAIAGAELVSEVRGIGCTHPLPRKDHPQRVKDVQVSTAGDADVMQQTVPVNMGVVNSKELVNGLQEHDNNDLSATFLEASPAMRSYPDGQMEMQDGKEEEENGREPEHLKGRTRDLLCCSLPLCLSELVSLVDSLDLTNRTCEQEN